MSEHVMVGRDPQGRPVYAEVLSAEEIAEQLKVTPEWQEFKDRFDMSVESNHTLLGWLYAEKLGDDPGVDDYRQLIRTVLAAGGVVTVNGTTYEFELRRQEPEPIPEPEVRKDKNGRPLSESQLRWSEYRQFSETHSSEECKNRAKVDAEYASFRRTNFEREAQQTPSTQFQIAGQALMTESKPKITPELVTWSEEYRRTPMEKVRQLRSPLLNPLGHKDYTQKLESALAAGLV